MHSRSFANGKERFKTSDGEFLKIAFITLIFFSYIGGILFSLLILVINAFSILNLTVSLPVSNIPILNEIDRQIRETYLLEQQREIASELPTEVVYEQSTPVPIVESVENDEEIPVEEVSEEIVEGPTPVILPSPTPTLVISSLEFAPEELCSPISGVEFYELQSIISQPYNVPNPFSDLGHHGVDFGSYNFRGNPLRGKPIQAVFSGEVVGIIVDRPPIGNSIILETKYEELPESLRSILNIQEGQSLYHLYAHLFDPPEYWIGEKVECGDEIARLGSSQTAEAHIHFETRIGSGGFIIPSMAFYDSSATEEEQNMYLWWRTSGDLMPFDPMSLFANFR